MPKLILLQKVHMSHWHHRAEYLFSLLMRPISRPHGFVDYPPIFLSNGGIRNRISKSQEILGVGMETQRSALQIFPPFPLLLQNPPKFGVLRDIVPVEIALRGDTDDLIVLPHHKLQEESVQVVGLEPI